MRNISVAYVLAALVPILWPAGARAEGPAKSPAVKSAAVETTDGKSLDKDGNPTYRIAADGTVDWYTYSGFRRYHSECHVCHGPNGDGSSFAPALKDIAQADHLQRIPRHRRERPQERDDRAGERHAGVRQ